MKKTEEQSRIGYHTHATQREEKVLLLLLFGHIIIIIIIIIIKYPQLGETKELLLFPLYFALEPCSEFQTRAVDMLAGVLRG